MTNPTNQEKNSGKKNQTKGKSSTQEKVIGSVRLMPKLKPKDQGKHSITIKNFAKHSTRKDKGNKRQRSYMFLRWKRRSNKKAMHFSHFQIDTSKNKLPDCHNVQVIVVFVLNNFIQMSKVT